MGKFDRIIIVSDVDGTYKAHTDHGGLRNAAALDYFKREGGRFCLATGRILPTLLDIFPDLAGIVNFPCILGNGTYIYDFQHGQRYFDSYVDPDSLWELLRSIERDFPDAGIRITCADGTFLVPFINESVKHDVNGEYNYTLREVPFDCMTAADKQFWNKVVLHITDIEVIDTIQRRCIEADISGVVFLKSWPTLLEVLPAEGTKGKMLARLKELAGTPDCVIYAVGDYDNDEEMLSMADVAVAPANAVEAIKALADIEVCSCEDGAIGNLIEILDKSLL